MKKTLQIASNELRILFYSPVAWLILIIFTIQSFTAFTSGLSMGLQSLDFGWGVMGDGLTEGVYTNLMMGYYNSILRYLYLYIPLLTMSLMSREFSSGSIKLLYSSPISNCQIILGKFVAMLGYGLALIAVLLIQMFLGMYFIPNFDTPAILAAMFGIFLLIATYSAIGLFMSCLTQYQVVAAMLTLAMLSVLDQIGSWGQEYDFMRNVAYWLSLKGRVGTFQSGMIDTENTLYFILVSGSFLWLSILRLNANRQKQKLSAAFVRYLGVICIACVLGYLTSMPIFKLYFDASDTQRNTLTKNTRDIIEKMGDEDLTITAYVNALDTYDFWSGLPSSRMNDTKFWEMYTRFKPSIKLDYVLYYDSVLVENRPKVMIATAGGGIGGEDEEPKVLTLEDEFNEICRAYGDLDKSLFITPDSIHKIKDLRDEKNVFVRELTCSNGNSTFLRMFNDAVHVPTEAEIAAAIKRLVMELPVVGFAEGQGERSYHGTSDREYNFAIEPHFRPALFNQGFDVMPVNFAMGIPDTVNIVVIGEMKRPFDENEQAHFEEYLERGGNLLIITEPRRRESMEALLSQFGVKQEPGVLARHTTKYDPILALFRPTEEAAAKFYRLGNMLSKPTTFVTMPSCSPLSWTEDKGYDVMPLIATDSLFWNEMQTTDFVDDTARYEPETGEVRQVYYGALALSKQVGEKEQRIVILPDADCLSNQETNAYRSGIENANFNLINTMFSWMSYDEVPVDVRRPEPKDTSFNLVKEELTIWEYILHWTFPILLLLIYIIIWLRRRNR